MRLISVMLTMRRALAMLNGTPSKSLGLGACSTARGRRLQDLVAVADVLAAAQLPTNSSISALIFSPALLLAVTPTAGHRAVMAEAG